MKRLGCIVIATAAVAVVVLAFVPLWKVPYFQTEPLKYEAISYIERGQPGETVEYMVGGWSEDVAKLLDLVDEKYIVPYSFPIISVFIKNVETLVPEQLAFSEEDEARLTILTEQYERIEPFYKKHFNWSKAWKQKPLWERAGRRIIAVIPFSSVWRRYIPAFKYGITPEDGMSLRLQVIREMSALKSKKDTNSPATFTAYITYHASGQSYSSRDRISLMRGEVGIVEFRVYEINMDEDEWSWEYEVRPEVKCVTRHKKVTLFRYLLHKFESP